MRLRRAASDRRGAIAPIFALVAVPLIMATGVGIDVSRVVSSRNQLQDALDNAALALGRLPTSTPLATLQSTAQQWVAANIPATSELGAVALTVSVNGDTIDVSGVSQIKPYVVGIMGVQNMAVDGHSQVKWGTNHVELALVLDNTGSMADDNKLSSLVSAAGTLVDTLSQSATNSGDPQALKIGVVPFSMTVNIGSTYQGQTWLSGVQPLAYGAGLDPVSGANRFTLLSQMQQTWGGCIEDRPMPYDVQDTAPSLANGATLFVPFFAPDEPDDNTIVSGSSRGRTSYYNFPNNYENDLIATGNWQTQEMNAAKYIKKPASGSDAYWGDSIGPNSGCQTTSLLRMTTDMSQVKAKLGQMIAAGDTEIPVGLVWGWHVLSPNLPFADGSAYGTKGVIKIAVLVTDGQNTYGTASNPNGSYYTALGYAWEKRISSAGTATATASALNTRLQTLCSNMQAQNIVIYTVPLEVTDPSIKSLLQNCASAPGNYLDVSSSSGLQAAFNNIAGSITQLRLTK